MKIKNLILGAGLSGISTSYHLGHEDCFLLEKKSFPLGLCASYQKNGFTWDFGPHVSFTKNKQVREIFDLNAEKVISFSSKVSNWYYDRWIGHPVQTHLSQMPQDLCESCYKELCCIANTQDFIEDIQNYRQWLEKSVGSIIADEFVELYTKKYWLRKTSELSADWIGGRVHRPSREEVEIAHKGSVNTHYIKNVYYPEEGGYQSFVQKFSVNAKIRYSIKINRINLIEKYVQIDGDEKIFYEHLYSSIPLPNFITLLEHDIPQSVQKACTQLACSKLLLLNFEVSKLKKFPGHWIYVYDKNKVSTRINFPSRLSSNNAPDCKESIQVEVYVTEELEEVEIIEYLKKVSQELISMDLIDEGDILDSHSQFVDFANVIFTNETKLALENVYQYLEQFGFIRTKNDISPLEHKAIDSSSPLNLIGRFGLWKYYWSDDCSNFLV